jgi:hypothetical protein
MGKILVKGEIVSYVFRLFAPTIFCQTPAAPHKCAEHLYRRYIFYRCGTEVNLRFFS